MKKILITGGAGFIGSHLVRRFVNRYPEYHIYNLDALTYAGNLENIADIEKEPNYTFVKGDIVDAPFIDALFATHQFDGVLHLAAESHVDRSISDPLAFVKTNVIGTMNLLNAAKTIWKDNSQGKRFYHISTDEVYGSLGAEGLFTETTAYDPNSPYSASKASSDHFVRAYGETYGLPYVITNCSNNYGPYQFPEKLWVEALSLRYTKAKVIEVPKHTYLSIPFLADKLNIELKWKDDNWKDYYYLTDKVIDAAVLWKKDSYIPGTYMSISFQYQKHLSLGRGGVILTDDKNAAEELKKMSYDGRLPNIPWREQDIATMGYHYYMTPETAQLGLNKLENAINSQPRQWVIEDWPNLTNMKIFK